MEPRIEAGPQILISGASGLIGQALQEHFRVARVPYVTLARSGAFDGTETIRWDPYRFEFRGEMNRLNGLRAAIHLSGENVASGRWTAAKKRRLRESRIQTTRSLVELFRHLDAPPKVLLCASAVGIYGDRGDETLDESSNAGTGFLAELCRDWEAVASEAQSLGIRVVHLRFGVVLAKNGGALRKMLPLFRLGLGGRIGNGRQWMSWISMRDVVRAVDFCMNREEIRGAMNLCANPVTNGEFTRMLAAELHRPALLPAPAFALRMAFGAMADDALLASTRAVPANLLHAGFVFQEPALQGALKNILAD